LPQKYGIIEYINQEKKTLHIITNDSEQIFYQFDKELFRKGQFLTFKQYKKKVKEEVRNFSVDIKICDKEIALPNFKNRIVVVDDVNESKKLFHYVLGKKLLTGIAFFDDIDIYPKVGDFIKVFYYVKKDKEGKKKLVTLHIEQTDEVNSDLQKEISGELEIKNGGNFAFIGDYYVPKSILEKYSITDDRPVSAKAVYTGDGDKWKVYEIDNEFDKEDKFNWKFIFDNKDFFNQLFSTFYCFNENELDQYYGKIEVGSPYLDDKFHIIQDTKFGLIYNKKIVWTEHLKSKYYKQSELFTVTENADVYSYEINFDELPLEILDEMKHTEWFETKHTADEYGYRGENEEAYNELGESIYNIGKYYQNIIAKQHFTNIEIIEIIENNKKDYFFNNNFYDQVTIKLNADIKDFSIMKFYEINS
jgi:hypothetical protein